MVQLPTLASNPEMRTIELSQLLERLQKTILHPDTERERRLRTSEYERARMSSNLAFARDLLTRVEQDAFAIKAPAKRQEVQVDLSRRRELLEQLYDRMKDLEQMEVKDEEDESDEGEDILAGVMVDASAGAEQPQDHPSDDGDSIHQSQDVDSKVPESAPASTTHSDTPSPPSQTTPPPPPRQQQPPPTQTTSELRSRKQAPEPQSQSTARAALFSRRRPPPGSSTTAVQSITAEAILDHQREEQEELSKHILQNASRLKESSKMFSQLLEEDREVVGRASDSMDTTGRRMDAAGSKMGLLTRMTEGEGWFGRMKLYAMVYALIVACFVVVFVSPKIRF